MSSLPNGAHRYSGSSGSNAAVLRIKGGNKGYFYN